MPSRFDRSGSTPSKSERQQKGAKRGESTQASWADVPLAEEPQGAQEQKVAEVETNSTPFGPSILKEIFPDHGTLSREVIDRIPSPSRRRPTRSPNQSPSHGNGSPVPPSPVGPRLQMHIPQTMSPTHMSTSPAHLSTSPTHMSTMPDCRQWEMPMNAPAPPPPTESAFGGSYRDRLRAGGRGAFQRAFDAGFVPRTMNQEWNATATGTAYAEGFMNQHSEMHHGWGMDYAMSADAQSMWHGSEHMQNDDYWGTPMTSPPYPQMQQGPMQDFSDCYQHQMTSQQQDCFQQQPMMPMMPSPHQPENQPMLQIPAMTPQDQCPPLPPMQMQLPQMEPTNGGDNAPADIGRCMAIVMPGATQFPCDKDLMAAHLRAAADCQCYED